VRIEVDASTVRETSWHEYAIRFVFGGLITAVAGIITKYYGASIGGLFLAFPAILPASATLIEKHEATKKEEKGVCGAESARKAASVEAAGSAMGSIGLLVFALLVWLLLPSHNPWIVLVGSTLSWFIVSLVAWHVRKRS